MTIGIYRITNNTNDLSYIGESLNIERRWDEHINDLNNKSHHSYKLQDAWNRYGKDNFTFEILEEVERLSQTYKTTMRLIYIEDQYINKYDSLRNGYNVENTMEKILNREKKILRQPMDATYLNWIIKK